MAVAVSSPHTRAITRSARKDGMADAHCHATSIVDPSAAGTSKGRPVRAQLSAFSCAP